jgi:iron complex outermembrane recepter protein
MNLKSVFKALLLLCAWILIQAVPALTHAAPPDQSGAAPVQQDDLLSIIVTARRVEERLQDVPISISVFNQQQLDNRNIVNASDLAAYTPSLQVNTNFGAANSAFAIRGFVQDIGTQPSVGVFFADVVAPRGASNNLPIGDGAGPGDFWDLQNVQVLKGPQGTLFGRNTTGGDILIVPQKPTSKEEGYAELTFGNYGEKRIQAVENLPINDNIRFRIGVDHQNRDGYENNDAGVYPARLGDVDYTDVRASLVVDITPDVENYTIASYLVSDTHGDVQKLVACNPTQSAANFLGLLACGQLAQEQAKGAGFYTVQSTWPNPDTRLEEWQVINTTTWHASDNLTVKNIGSYAVLDEKYRTALFGTNFFLAPGLPVSFTNVAPVAGGATADESTATEEIQLQGNAFGNKLTWQAGGYVEDEEPLQKVGSQSPVLLNCIDSDDFNCTAPLGSGDVNYTAAKTYFNDFGLYEQSSYAVTDALKFTEGFRWTWDRTHSNDQLISYVVPAPLVAVPTCTQTNLTPPGCYAVYRTQSDAPTWLLGVDYKPTDNTLVYGKYSRGYRAGATSPSAPTEFAIFKPERVDTYETGFKSSFTAPISGTFNVATFYNNFSDQQLQLGFDAKPGADVAPASGILNAGKSRIWGVELESSLVLFPGFTLDTGYTYLNAKIKSIEVSATPADSPYIIQPTAHPGDTLVLTPRSKVSTTGTYTFPIPDTVGRVSLSATFTHTNKELVNYADREAPIPEIAAFSVLPALNLVNMDLTWKSIAGTHVDASAFVSNLTNKEYYTFVAGLYSPSLGFETAELGQPRFYGVRLRYSW